MARKKLRYNTSKEWLKDIKFNNHWYHLKSLFDLDHRDDKFDFNDTSLMDNEPKYNFNVDPINKIYKWESNVDDNKYDFNDDCMNEWIFKDDTGENEIIANLNSVLQKYANNEWKIQFTVNYLHDEHACIGIEDSSALEGIKINKNIIGHSIEDFIFNMLKNNKELLGNIYRNASKRSETLNIIDSSTLAQTTWRGRKRNLIDTDTYDILLVKQGQPYYLEVKSGEAENDSNIFLRRNIRIHDNQKLNLDNLIFIMVNYLLEDDGVSAKITNIKVCLVEENKKQLPTNLHTQQETEKEETI